MSMSRRIEAINMNNRANRIVGLLLMMSFSFLLLSLPGQVRAEGSRISSQDIRYVGSFRLPNTMINGSRFGFGGRGIAVYHDPLTGIPSLFMEGHAWYPGKVGQVEIPGNLSATTTYRSLPEARMLQGFYDITDGKFATLGSTDYNAIFGMLAYGNRLIVGATSWYDAASKQKNSHGYSGFDLARSDDFSGFYRVQAQAGPRSLGGYMTTIPSAWREAFGGPVLTGNAALSIISSISSGPAASVFDPDDLGVASPTPATTLVFYNDPIRHYLVSGSSTENTFSFGSTVNGIAFPDGSESVLFFGLQSMADGYCYGFGVQDPAQHRTYCHADAPTVMCCYDPCNGSKGGHGYPYKHYVWAYDADDLLLVKNRVTLSAENRTANVDASCANGTVIEPWCLKPYAAWAIDDLNKSGCASIRGAGYDPLTRNVYLTQGFGEEPKVDVFHIDEPDRADKIAPLAPKNLRIIR